MKWQATKWQRWTACSGIGAVAGLIGGTAGANPIGPVVVNGAAGFDSSVASQLLIQNSPGAIINWQSFGIAQGEVTRFLQQSSSSAVLNRVTGGDPSAILGQLQSNGRVFLVNPNGIVFGEHAVIDTAGFIASTLGLSDEDFLAGRYNFAGNADAGRIVNRGYIRVGRGGDVLLVAPNIENRGVISTEGGNLILAAGEKILLTSLDSDSLAFEVRAPSDSVVNLGQILANGGAARMFAGTIQHSGAIEANTIGRDAEGRIVLSASRDLIVAAGARVSARGSTGAGGHVTLAASGVDGEGARIDMQGDVAADGRQGGRVELRGDRIALAGAVHADGIERGGSISIDAKAGVVATSGSRLSARSEFTPGVAPGALPPSQTAVVAPSLSGPTTGVRSSGLWLATTAPQGSASGATLAARSGISGSTAGTSRGGSVRVETGGTLFTSSTIDVRGDQGGQVRLLGDAVTLAAARVDASGRLTGGTIRVGGGFQGKEPLRNAEQTIANEGSLLRADALENGPGGSVVLWSERSTRSAAAITARGGAAGGNGGIVEISGGALHADIARVNVSAVHGSDGTLLLDPKTIRIVGAGQAGIDPVLDPNPGTGNNFGSSTQRIGNRLVVFDPADDFAGSDAGAVYLFNLDDGSLVSQLTGAAASDAVGSNGFYFGIPGIAGDKRVVYSPSFNSDGGAFTLFDVVSGTSGTVSSANSLVGSAGDQIGSDGFTAVGGRVAMLSPEWNGTRGAVTWVDPAALQGTVNSGNSLVGTSVGDRVGLSGIVQLAGGSAGLVRSPDWNGGAGAITWFSASAPTTGAVSAANSLVGSTAGDAVGSGFGGIDTFSVAGKFIVYSPFWRNGAATDAGAITIASNTSGVAGAISSANSLVGTNAGDGVGNSTLLGLGSDRFLFRNVNWNSGAGAVTWFTGAAGITGAVSSANSLVGSTAGDGVGSAVRTFLPGDRYAVLSPNWSNGGMVGAGAVTYVDAATGITGAVTSANSLVGTSIGDRIGNNATQLFNGNLVVTSTFWNGSRGAVTFLDPAQPPVTGAVSAANSLVGSTAGDAIGSNGIVDFGFGLFGVLSPNWDNTASVPNAGAVTFVSTSTGITGAVDSSNSLVGNGTGDQIGSAYDFLSSGKLVITAPLADVAGAADAGAVVFVDPSVGLTGFVSATNALVGSNSGDQVGSGGVVDFGFGKYFVFSPNWDNGVATDSGAVTAGDVFGGVVGAIDNTNSLVGTHLGDQIGASYTQLGNGNLLVRATGWNSGMGAVAFVNTAAGAVGDVSSTTALTGDSSGDGVGSGGVFELANGNYLVRSPGWDDLGGVTDVGAVTFGSGTSGVTGVVGSGTSVVGGSAGDAVGSGTVADFSSPFDGLADYYFLRTPTFDNGAATNAGAITKVDATNGTVVGTGSAGAVVSAANSLVGSATGDVGTTIQRLSNGNFVVINENFNQARGAVTLNPDSAALAGTIDSSNSFVGVSPNDRIGSNGFFAVFVNGVETGILRSPFYNGGAGALTLYDFTTGVTGTLDSSNSLIGSSASDGVGGGGTSIITLDGQRFVARNLFWNSSAGAVTWFDATVGLTGVISSANSLVGASAGDQIGSAGVAVFPDGTRYGVYSPLWDNGGAANAGAITFAAIASGRVGAVDNSNSLVGTQANDLVGNFGPGGIIAFGGGQYYYRNSSWHGNAGALTFMTDASLPVGAVSSANSLIGSTANDSIGSSGAFGVLGRIGVFSPVFDNGPIVDAGAVTIVPVGTVGAISSGNSLVGGFANDRVGNSGLFTIGPGYALRTTLWNSGAGAITWFSTNSIPVGQISSGNSLVGSAPGDAIGTGSGSFTVLSNGFVLLNSPFWDNQGAVDAGAFTLVTPGTTGVLSADNSIVGSAPGDRVGSGGVFFDGGCAGCGSSTFVLSSPEWGNGSGAATFVDPRTRPTGALSASNSLVGTPGDFIGSDGEGSGISSLGANSNRFLVVSPLASRVLSTGEVLADAGRIDIINGTITGGGAAGGFSGSLGFNDDPGGEATLSAAAIEAFLGNGGELVLQANNDIELLRGAAIRSESGALTLQAGRSITIKDDLFVGGALTMVANFAGATQANRDSGPGNVVISADPAVRVAGRVTDVTGQNVIVEGGPEPGAFAALIGVDFLRVTATGDGSSPGLIDLRPGTGVDADALLITLSGSIEVNGDCPGCEDIFLFPVGNGLTQTGIFYGFLDLDAANRALVALSGDSNDLRSEASEEEKPKKKPQQCSR